MPADLVLSSAATDPTLEQVLAALGYEPANDSEVVHLTGDEAISGTKSLTGTIEIKRDDGNVSVRIRPYNSAGSGTGVNAPKLVEVNPSKVTHQGSLVVIWGREGSSVDLSQSASPNLGTGLASPEMRFVSKWNDASTVYEIPANFGVVPDNSSFGYWFIKVCNREGMRIKCNENRTPIVQIGNSTEVSAQLNIEPSWTGKAGVRVKLVSGQTANAIETVDSTGTLEFAVLPGGPISCKSVKKGSYTVATLPSASANANTSAVVTDSSVAAAGNYGSTVAGGGSNRVKVFSNGTNWVIG